MKKAMPIILGAALVFTSVGWWGPSTIEAAPSLFSYFKGDSDIVKKKVVPGVTTQTGKKVTVLVEMNEQPVVQYHLQVKAKRWSYRKVQEYQAQLLNKQRTLSKQVKEVAPTSNVEKSYQQVFSGLAVQVDGSDVTELAALPEVKRIYPVRKYKALMSESAPLVQAPKVWEETDANGQPLTGKGIKVAVIDTGIDSTHPDLAGKVIGGYDFVDQDPTPQDENGHGTHVAGIIAANGKVKGIAPEASLFAYRVLNADGVGDTDAVLAAIDKAVTDRVGVINMSLGSDYNDPDDPLALAIDRTVKQGITVVVANGNSGPGRWTVGTPATSREAISVGASTKLSPVPLIQAVRDTRKLEANIIPYGPSFPLQGTYSVVDVPNNRIVPNLTGKIALFKRSGTSIDALALKAKKAGAVAVMIYNDRPGDWTAKVSNPSQANNFAPVATLSGYYGTYLKAKLANAGNRIAISSMKKERLADFSSRGPVTTTWAIKPDVVAPGVNILSTFPKSLYYSGYLKESGTSMAAPHVAGAVALIKQSHPTWTPQEIKAALANTAISLLDSERKSLPAIEQGSGRIDIYRAIHTETLALPNNLSFGLFNYNSGTKQLSKTLQIKNLSSSVKNYNVRVKLDRTSTGFQVTTPATLQVQPNSTANLTATLSLNTALPKGDYSGTILISDGVKEIKVPFITFISPEDVPF